MVTFHPEAAALLRRQQCNVFVVSLRSRPTTVVDYWIGDEYWLDHYGTIGFTATAVVMLLLVPMPIRNDDCLWKGKKRVILNN